MANRVLLTNNGKSGFSGDVVFEYGTATINGIEEEKVLLIGKQLDLLGKDGVKILIDREKGNADLIALLNAVIEDLSDE